MKSEKLCGCGCGEYTELAKKTDKRRGHVKGEPMSFINGHSSINGAARPTLDVLPALSRTGSISIEIGSKEITMEDMANLRSINRRDAAEVYDSRVRFMESQHKRTFVEIGMILVEFENSELHKEIIEPATGSPYTSFDRWLMDAAPVSRTTGYDAKKAFKALGDVPVVDLKQMSRANIKALSNQSSRVQRDPKIIEAAKTLTEEEFLDKVDLEYPDQHVEAKRPMHLKPAKQARKAIDYGLDVAMWAFDVPTREEAIDFVFQEWLDAECAVEGYTSLSNRDAYNQAHQKAKVA